MKIIMKAIHNVQDHVYVIYHLKLDYVCKLPFFFFLFIMYAIFASAIFLCVLYLPQLISDWHAIDATGFAAASYLAIVPGIFGYWLLSVTAPNLPISHVSALLFLIPVVATLLGTVVLGEIPVYLALLGGGLTLLGAIWTQLSNRVG